MKFGIKKYIYFVNDFTNLLLNKDRQEWAGKYQHLLQISVILLVLLLISISLNIYLYVR